ncbi:MAG: spermine synthase, partial [Thermodesulfobacteriota bacterium]
PFTMKNLLVETYKIFKEVYKKEEIYCYKAGIPSFGGDNAFIMRCPYPNPEIPKWKEIPNTYYYDHDVHRTSFGIPKFWKEALKV